MNNAAAIAALAGARRVVVKIGSALLVEAESGLLREAWLESIVADVVAMRARGQQVLLVSSGAIALGRCELKLPLESLRLDASQAAAAVGQIRLAHAFGAAFGEHQVRVAQILLTLGDTEQRDRYLNATRTLEKLLSLGALPVINENDTVATEEIRFGDNDRLAARVAQMVAADVLVLLSDVDGLYSADPAIDADARHISRVERIDERTDALGGATRSPFGTGGMRTKIAAARIATAAGCGVVLASGREERPLSAVAVGARCTWFDPNGTPLAARKRWIAGSLQPQGVLHIDAGAAAALRDGKSLLPAGVVAIDGEFGRGDTVRIVDAGGQDVAVGLSAYTSAESRLLLGLHSSAIEHALGYRGRTEIIHRNDLVLTAFQPSPESINE